MTRFSLPFFQACAIIKKVLPGMAAMAPAGFLVFRWYFLKRGVFPWKNTALSATPGGLNGGHPGLHRLAVGMGNIWLFPAVSPSTAGPTFLIPYLIFVVIIGSTGVIGEMAFGRATRSGPIGAFGYATKLRFGHERPGRLLGLIPVLGSLALAIGYSVVTGWIFKYTADALTGTLSRMSGLDAFAAHFNATAAGNVPWQLVGMAVTSPFWLSALAVGSNWPTRS